MSELLTVFVAALVALIPITNPIGGLAAFAGLTDGLSPREIRAQATRTGVFVFAILAAFTLAGSIVLDAFGIDLTSVQIAGGLVVAHSGFRMIVPTAALSEDEAAHAKSKTDISFSPMALPLIAGPGAMGVVIALAARYPSALGRIGILLAVLVLAGIVVVLLRVGTPLALRMGPTGVGALTRVMGFLILCIGVELIVAGVSALVRSLT